MHPFLHKRTIKGARTKSVSRRHILTYEAGNDINREDSQKGMMKNGFCLNKGIIQEQSSFERQSDHMKFTLVSKVMQNLLIL